MIQEDKELLLKDLSARLIYGVIVDIKYNKEHGSSDRLRICSEGSLMLNTDLIGLCIEKEIHLKPYLRPMSSMTEEEKEEIAFIRDRDFQSVRKWFRDESIKETGNICPITCGEIDFCNKKHLDYRGLIPMGLALEAPEGMYNLNNE